MKAFADLYRRLDSATSTRAKQAAMVEAFAGARDDPGTRGSAAWMVYFLAGGKPQQIVPTRLMWRLAVEASGYPEWLCEECYHSVGDLAETLALLLPEGVAGEEISLEAWMRQRLLPLPALEEDERYARLERWVDELPADQRLAFFKLITGELRVGVSRLQVVKALAEVAGIEESRMAQRIIGYAQARRTPSAEDFEALIAEVAHGEAAALDAGRPYPFYLAQSWQRPVVEMAETLGLPSDWVIEWKFDGIRAQLVRRGDNWRLWSRGEELISDAYPDLEPLARALPPDTTLDGELVVMHPPPGARPADSLDGLAPFASLQQRLGRKVVSAKTLKELPVAFIVYDLVELDGQDIRGEPQHGRRASLAMNAAWPPSPPPSPPPLLVPRPRPAGAAAMPSFSMPSRAASAISACGSASTCQGRSGTPPSSIHSPRIAARRSSRPSRTTPRDVASITRTMSGSSAAITPMACCVMKCSSAPAISAKSSSAADSRPSQEAVAICCGAVCCGAVMNK